MKRWTLCAALIVLGAVAADVHANAAPRPFPTPVAPGVLFAARPPVDLVVEIDANAKDAKLQIPAQLLMGPPPRPGRLGADAGHVPTLIAGLALTCAFVSGGFWLVRRGRGRTLAAILTLTLLAAGVTAVLANIPRFPPANPPAKPGIPVKLPADIKLSGKIILEIVPQGNKVKLIITKDMAPRATKPAKPEGK